MSTPEFCVGICVRRSAMICCGSMGRDRLCTERTWSTASWAVVRTRANGRWSTASTSRAKQSGGHGQYGHVKMRFEPSGDLEAPYVFEQEVVGGAVPKNYFPAVEKGYRRSRSERSSGSISGCRCKGCFI